MPGGREDRHIDTGLADQVLGGLHAEAGDLVELGDLPLVRLAQGGDLLVQHGDLGAVVVDVVQHHRQDESVLFGEERAVQSLSQRRKLAPHHAAGHLRQHPGVPLEPV